MQNHPIDEQDLVADLVRDLVKERRRDRRWKNLRFFAGFLLILFFLGILFSRETALVTTNGSDEKGYVSLIRLEGLIAPSQDFSAEQVLPLLKDAFSDKNAKGVILDINSGGGTPVQAAIIHDAIVELKNKYHKKVVVVGEDLLASGAYFVAVAADKIYVNPNTITGSIGVIMKGFGFTDAIQKIGVERRVYASGVNKDRLDPFLPQNKEDIEKIRTVIDEVHTNFNQVVLQGRQGKLHATPEQLFTGDFWSGTTALKLGLVDVLGNLSNALQDEFHVASYKDYSQSDAFKNLAGKLGMSLNMALSNGQVGVLEKL